MTMQIVHYILLVSGALGTGLPVAAASFPALDKPYFMAAAAVCVLVAVVAGAVSGPIQTKSGAASVAKESVKS